MIIQPDYMTVRPNPTAVAMDWAINESKSKDLDWPSAAFRVLNVESRQAK